MKNAKKGFTLIELMAVIIILIVLLLIVMPSVNAVIKKSKVKSFVASAQGIVKTASIMSKQNQIDDLDNSTITLDTLEYNGQRYEIGAVAFDQENRIGIAIWEPKLKICAIKAYEEKLVTVYSEIVVKERCKIPGGPWTIVKLTTPLGNISGCNSTYEYALQDFPKEVEVTLDDETTIMVQVKWIRPSDWSGGTHYGDLILPKQIYNPNNIQAIFRYSNEC